MSPSLRRPTPDRIVNVVVKASRDFDSSRQSAWGVISELQAAAKALGWDTQVVLEVESVGVAADWRAPIEGAAL